MYHATWKKYVSGRIKDCMTLEQKQSHVGISNYIVKYRAIVFKNHLSMEITGTGKKDQ